MALEAVVLPALRLIYVLKGLLFVFVFFNSYSLNKAITSEWGCTTRGGLRSKLGGGIWEHNTNHFQSMYRIDGDENLPGTHRKTLVCRLLSGAQACEGALCCRPHIVLRLSPETNAQRTSRVTRGIVDGGLLPNMKPFRVPPPLTVADVQQ